MSVNIGSESDATTKRLAVLASAAGLSAWAMDVAATQVALPTMQEALGLSVTGAQWLLNLSIMILAGLVTVGGSLGDRLGRVRAFRLGALVLMAGALMVLLGGRLGNDLLVFIGRAVEGVGAGFIIPASTALLIDVFKPEERGSAQGKAFAYSMLMTAVAPMAAGVIVQRAGWEWAYLLPVALAAVSLLILARISVPHRSIQTAPFDMVGATLLFITVVTLIFGFMQAGSNGWGSPEVAGSIVAGLISLILLVVISLRKSAPLVQFRLLKIRSVAIAMSVGVLRFLPPIMSGAFVARYAQQVLELTPTQTGMLAVVPTLAQFLAAPVAGKLQDSKGPRVPVPIGIILMMGGSGVLASGFGDQRLGLIIIATALIGVGFAFTNPLSVAALNETPLQQRGMLAGLLPLAGQFGSALWVSVVTALLVSRMEVKMAAGVDAAAAQADALSGISWLVLGVMVVTLFISLALPKPKAVPTTGQPDLAPAQS